MSTAITPKERMETLRGMLVKAKDSFATVLPKHITPDRMLKVALVAASRNPALLQCDPKTVVQAVMTAAQLGLDCSGTLGSAYLVPYGTSCQLIPGYRGLIDLARRSGEIASIEAHVVYEKDEFQLEYGLDPRLVHKPYLKGDPGTLVFAYAIGILRDGTKQVEVMTRAQIDGIRGRSRAAKTGPWVTDYDEMARKTVVRRLCKYLPLSVELETAISIEDQVEAGEQPVIDVDIEIPIEEPQRRTDEVAEKLKAKRQVVAEEEPQDQSKLFKDAQTSVQSATE